MSLYRTWRPKTFAELVGQDAVVRTLTGALASGKIAHAYLFSGPRGSGKTSAAKIMARCLNCEHGPMATPDNTCVNCLAMLEGSALDVIEIDAASNRGIDEIRALRESVKFSPSAMRYKVYIVDEVHMLTKEGANAFLKTLEEPPAHAVLILATTEPERLPVTILSRCQRYAFRRIAIPTMIERMRVIAAAEAIRIDDAALSAIAYRADGGLRDALTMLEQAAIFADGEITAQTLDLAFGSSGRNLADALLDASLRGDAAAALGVIEDASDGGADMLVLARALVAEFRNLLVARVDPELLARDLAPEDARRAAERAPSAPPNLLLRALRLLADAVAAARTSGNPRLELETALLRLVLGSEELAASAPSRSIVPPETRPVMQILEPVPVRILDAATVVPLPEAATPALLPTPPHADASSAEPPSLQRVRAAWSHIRARVEGEFPPMRMTLARAVVDALDGNAVVLRLPDPWSGDAVRENLASIEAAIENVLGQALRVTVKVEAAAATRGKAALAAKTPLPTPTQEQDDLDEVDQLFRYADERIKE